jgi:hypothetical protein
MHRIRSVSPFSFTTVPVYIMTRCGLLARNFNPYSVDLDVHRLHVSFVQMAQDPGFHNQNLTKPGIGMHKIKSPFLLPQGGLFNFYLLFNYYNKETGFLTISFKSSKKCRQIQGSLLRSNGSKMQEQLTWGNTQSNIYWTKRSLKDCISWSRPKISSWLLLGYLRAYSSKRRCGCATSCRGNFGGLLCRAVLLCDKPKMFHLSVNGHQLNHTAVVSNPGLAFTHWWLK